MQKTQTMFFKALQYLLTDGYSVIPLGKDKRPLLASWKEYQTRLPSEEELKTWWEKWPSANIGVVTGKISGISVIDIDIYKANNTTLDKFPKTLTIKTGNGGYHLYYEYVEGLSISANAYANLPGVDIRSDGGYVVAPPSVTSYLKEGKPSGGEYTYHDTHPITSFPTSLISPQKKKRTLLSTISVETGGRNDSLASVIGKLLQSEPDKDKFLTEVLPAAERINATYNPPLSPQELLTTFQSIMKKELTRREELVLSPIQLEGSNVTIPIRRSQNGTPYKDMANVLAVLEHHPYFKNTIRYNEFRQEIEYNGHPFEEGDLVKMQYFMQTDMGLHSLAKDAVYAAVQHCANMNKYDEAKDWLNSLQWDGTPRLHSWLSLSTGVEDNNYHAGVGAQWIMGAVRRIVHPGATFDYVLTLVGGQGIGKTSFFRILGGKWYKSYTGAMDNKDFCLALRGALIVDLDEGAALSKSDSIKMKSIITETHDEFRAPYDRVMKKYPRRFVFSMSTNDTEPFKDVTGNRRYWPVDIKDTVNFKWLEENREQIFAEAYFYLNSGKEIREVTLTDAMTNQNSHIAEDPWLSKIRESLENMKGYLEGDKDFKVTTEEIYAKTFPDESLIKLDRRIIMRIADVLKKDLGFKGIRLMIDGHRYSCWVLGEEELTRLREENDKKPRQLNISGMDVTDW